MYDTLVPSGQQMSDTDGGRSSWYTMRGNWHGRLKIWIKIVPICNILLET